MKDGALTNEGKIGIFGFTCALKLVRIKACVCVCRSHAFLILIIKANEMH